MKKLKRDRPTIGVVAGWYVYPGFIDSFLDHVFHGILSAAQDQECNLLLGCGIGVNYPTSQQRPAWPVLLPDCEFIPVGPWNCDGLIVATPVEQPGGYEYFKSLSASGFPVVYAGERETGRAVVVDNEYGIQQAMQHLANHGHRRIVFISGPASSRFSDVQHRREAYIASVNQLGLDADPALTIFGEHSEEGSRRAMEQFLKQGIPFTAVLASNDESAIGAMNALHAAGKLIPEDVAMIGFDDRFEAKAQVPLLTTVHHPMFELGYNSIELMLKTIYDGAADNEVIRIRPQLIIRESCGCLPGAIDAPAENPEIAKSAEIDPFLLTSTRITGNQPVFQKIIFLVNQAISNEMQRLRSAEVSYLSWRMVDSFEKSLMSGDQSNFGQTIQQIIEYVASRGDDVYAWQRAVSIMREHLPEILENPLVVLGSTQIDDMLHLARVVISEISRGQFSRLMVNQDRNASQIGQMTSLFFSAQSESEIFDVAGQVLPSIGIAQTAIAYYEAEGDDPVAWSQLKYPVSAETACDRFATREFPPNSLFPADRPFRVVLLPLSTPNESLGYVAFETGNIDYCGFIVRQMMASLKSVRLHQEAIEARRIAEEANQLKSRFLSMVSHELRTPLNLISGLSDMLMRESRPAGPDARVVASDDLESLYQGARHLDGLIRDVLDLASIDVGQLNLTLEILDLKEVVETAAAIGEKLAKDKNLSWEVDIARDLPSVLGDRTRLRQVVLNLINNAVKFTSRGRIILSVLTVDAKVIISISDTGLGIPIDEQKSIFDEFRQSSRTTSRGFGGLGLGLAICRHLVEKHGGQIFVSSTGEEGEGSTFYFSLPAIDHASTVPEAKNPMDGCQYVMILTSEMDGAEGLKRQMDEFGCQVKTTIVDKKTNWLTRLQIDPPDAVVVDRQLAAEQGWEILKALKEIPETQNIPILFYAMNENGTGDDLLEFNYLTKPVKPEKLAKILESQGLFDLQKPAIQDNRSGSEQTILIVDDNPEILNLHTRIIESLSKNYHPIQARDGREALDKIRRDLPSLVLLDLMMPDMDGFTVLEAMREDEQTRKIPVIVITGQALTEEDMVRLNHGVTSVLSKGIFNVNETAQQLKAILTRQNKTGSEQKKTVFKAIAFIHTHYAEPVSRADVATHVGMSERHLTRCFSMEVGLTPTTYLNRFRVRQAKSLLDQGSSNITDVAMEVGFSSSGYFSRVFKEEVGVAPREYLRKSD